MPGMMNKSFFFVAAQTMLRGHRTQCFWMERSLAEQYRGMKQDMHDLPVEELQHDQRHNSITQHDFPVVLTPPPEIKRHEQGQRHELAGEISHENDAEYIEDELQGRPELRPLQAGEGRG